MIRSAAAPDAALARVEEGTKGPTVLLDGREPVELRTLNVSAPSPGAG